MMGVKNDLKDEALALQAGSRSLKGLLSNIRLFDALPATQVRPARCRILRISGHFRQFQGLP
jgi:hypothetical protein